MPQADVTKTAQDYNYNEKIPFISKQGIKIGKCARLAPAYHFVLPRQSSWPDARYADGHEQGQGYQAHPISLAHQTGLLQPANTCFAKDPASQSKIKSSSERIEFPLLMCFHLPVH